MFRFGERRTLHQVPISNWWLGSKFNGPVFAKVDQALDLIAHYAPATYKSMRQDIASILISNPPGARGSYFHEIRMVDLSMEFVIDAETTPHSLASVLVHEAQHARLCRFGFGYEEPIRARIERLCYRAERNFARKIPGCEALVADAESWMSADLDPIFSNEGRYRRELDHLREVGCPEWTVRILGRIRPLALWLRRIRAR